MFYKEDTAEVVGILRDNGIEPALDEFNNQPLVWLTPNFVAVEVTSADQRDLAMKFFEVSFDQIHFTELNNGNFLIKAGGLKEEIKQKLSH